MVRYGLSDQREDDSRQILWVRCYNCGANMDATDVTLVAMLAIASLTLTATKLQNKLFSSTDKSFRTLTVNSNSTGLLAVVLRSATVTIVAQSTLSLSATSVLKSTNTSSCRSSRASSVLRSLRKSCQIPSAGFLEAMASCAFRMKPISRRP